MKKKTKIIGVITAVSASVATGYSLVFDLPSAPTLSIIDGQKIEKHVFCYENSDSQPIDNNGKINVLVWNIYKQNRDNWQQALARFSANTQLILLQESSLTPELEKWIADDNKFAIQVDAFKAFKVPAGVLSLSTSAPFFACAYTEKEPWIRLPKSGLFSLYKLSNGQSLAVVNLHAINFTYGTKEYQEQIKTLVSRLLDHSGPVLVGGDFNSWSAVRWKVLKRNLHEIGVEEVPFSPDNRKQFINGLPLDHLFYRGLTLDQATSPTTDASDHNPLIATFTLSSS
ncbi:endonuclease/exonuclease/phosphatase family protein [Vibrio sp. S4M6]|uniref:endonuclease/exonuclease/phosphatase family protein n=1 Tax=Vibrio sinus TaxID=2946865 RepID=UPI00202AA3D3|nr:endonuclease/exonuclease/phosphatase family protein [Vibrio sinus]MCL9782154.1 endonuclease/exonuclease/phosphatase family protein [Vibrio sinus]